jgi:hypothetical protein
LSRIEETKKVLQNAFDNYESFSFLRVGDGDLLMIDGQYKTGHHTNSPALQKELQEAVKITDERYILSATVGIYNDGTGAYGHIKDEQIKINLDNKLKNIIKKYRVEEIKYHPLVFQYCFEHELEWFINFFRKNFKDKKTLFIGGDYARNKPMIENLFNVAETVSFKGQKNAYYQLEDKMEEILDKVKYCDVIIPCLGMATRVLAKRFWNLNFDKIVLDVGVTIDLLAEDYHRRWAQDMLDSGIANKAKKLILG